jgi:uracil-DNA glycosylase
MDSVQLEKYFNLVDKPFDLANIDENYIIILSSCVTGNIDEMCSDNSHIFQQCNQLNFNEMSMFQAKSEKDPFNVENYVVHKLTGTEKHLIIMFTYIYCTSNSFGDDTIYERALRFRRLFNKLLNENPTIKSVALSTNFINVDKYHKQMYHIFLKDAIINRNSQSNLLKISLYGHVQSTPTQIPPTEHIRYVPHILNSKSLMSSHVYLFDPYDVSNETNITEVVSSVNPTWTKKLNELEVPSSWKHVFESPAIESKFIQLAQFVTADYEKFGNDIPFLPEQSNIFKAFELCPFNKLKAIIIGQDPYPNTTHAMGLAFSVKRDVSPIPGSLKNIYTALNNNKAIPFVTPNPIHGDLMSWAKQGVLMINTALTLRMHQGKNAHLTKWQGFTDELLRLISKEKRNIVFILWGGFAQKKAELIDDSNSRHLILKYIHPSPRNGSQFHNCPNFSQTNEYLIQNGIEQIDWNV